MKRFLNTILKFISDRVALVLLGLLITFYQATGATRTASVSGNWGSTSTWGGSSVPTLADDVVINNGINVTLNGAAECKTLRTMNTGSISILSYSLTVTGLITMARPTTTGTNFTLAVGAGTLSAGSLTMSATT